MGRGAVREGSEPEKTYLERQWHCPKPFLFVAFLHFLNRGCFRGWLVRLVFKRRTMDTPRWQGALPPVTCALRRFCGEPGILSGVEETGSLAPWRNSGEGWPTLWERSL